MSFNNPSTGLDVSQVAAAVWDALTDDHDTANTTGQSIDMIRNAAIAGTTADSLLGKIEGAVDGQLFPATALALSSMTGRVSTAENITTTITPSAGELHVFSVFGESLQATIEILEMSGNSGTNFFDAGFECISSFNMFCNATAAGVCTAVKITSTERFRWTTPASAGTYILTSLGYILS